MYKYEKTSGIEDGERVRNMILMCINRKRRMIECVVND